MKKTSVAVSICLFLVSAGSIANDTTATIKNGVVNYNASDDISMDSEVLEIGENEINITYTFTNHSDKDIKTDVAFPLPPLPVFVDYFQEIPPFWDALYLSYETINSTLKGEEPPYNTYKKNGGVDLPFVNHYGKYFLDFKVAADGERKSPSFIVNAKKPDGTDITKLLYDNGIPLSASYIQGFEGPGAIEKDPKLLKKLKKLKLVEERANPHYPGAKQYKFLWQLHQAFVWRQTFKAKKTITTTHSYRPSCGEYWVEGKAGLKSIEDIKFTHRDREEKSLKDVNSTPEQQKQLIEMLGKPTDIKNNLYYYQAKEIQYVLKTGSNWKGPIKNFKLIINPPKSTLMVLSNFDGKLVKNTDGKYVVEVKDFTPQKDLKILFIQQLQ